MFFTMMSIKWFFGIWCFVATSVIANGSKHLSAGGHGVPITDTFGLPKSPCPSIFTYTTDGLHWYGIIKIVSQKYSDEIKLQVKMDYGAHSPRKYKGHIELMEKKDVLENLYSGKPIAYKVNFPALYPLPIINLILLNGDTICTGDLLAKAAEAKGVVYIEHVVKLEEDESDADQQSVENQRENDGKCREDISYDSANFTEQDDVYVEPILKLEESDKIPHEHNAIQKVTTSTKPSTQSKPRISTTQIPQYKLMGKDETTTETTSTKTIEADDGFIQDDSVILLTIDQMVSQKSGQNEQKPNPRNRLTKLRVNSRDHSLHGQEKEEPGTQYTVLPTILKEFDTYDNIINREISRQKRQTGADEKNISEFQHLKPPSGNQECGIVGHTSLSLLGIEKGEWPWLVAIFIKKDGKELNFLCGGTLVSHRHIITVAHCTRGIENVSLDGHDLTVMLGVINIQAWKEDSDAERHDVLKIEPHPQYTGRNGYVNDIALLILENKVKFSKYISPACIWKIDNDQALLVGKNGTVVGWGRENGLIETEPQEVKVPIVSTDTCKKSNRAFRLFTSNTTLCAGPRYGEGLCNGISGTGLYVQINNRWYLRGTASVTINSHEVPCNLDQFLVYTDASKYDDWLQKIMSENP